MTRFPRVQLRHLSELPIVNGLSLPGSNDNPEWPRYIRTTDIASPTRLRDDVFASQPPEVASSAIVSHGDVLMTAAGASIGKSVRFLQSYPACFAGFLVRLRPRNSDSGRYLGYWMQSQDYWDQIAIGAVKSTIENFSASRYRALSVPLPPHDEQRAIADYLDQETAQIDVLVAKQEELIRLLRELRAGVLFQATTRGLDPSAPLKPSGLSWVAEVPVSWRVVNIRRVALMRTGHTPSRTVPEYWDNATIPWFTLADVWQLRDGTRRYLGETKGLISPLGLKNSAAELLPAGTVVLSRTASVGFSGIMPIPMATSQDFWNWVCGADLAPEYLLNVFRAMRSEFNLMMTGSTHKTIYQPTAAAMRIPVPPIDEQREIVKHIDTETSRVDSLIAKAEEHIALAKERRAALISAAVTGQLDVRTARKAR